jgi:hypothetical protein
MDAIAHNEAYDMYACRGCGYNTKHVANILFHVANAKQECKPPSYLVSATADASCCARQFVKVHRL